LALKFLLKIFLIIRYLPGAGQNRGYMRGSNDFDNDPAEKGLGPVSAFY
jgi:hypothetical protein